MPHLVAARGLTFHGGLLLPIPSVYQAQEKQKKKEEGMERTAQRKEERAKVFVAPKEPKMVKRKSTGDGDGNGAIDIEKLKKKLKIKKRAAEAQPATAFILGDEPAAKKSKKEKKEKKSKKSKKELL